MHSNLVGHGLFCSPKIESFQAENIEKNVENLKKNHL